MVLANAYIAIAARVVVATGVMASATFVLGTVLAINITP